MVTRRSTSLLERPWVAPSQRHDRQALAYRSLYLRWLAALGQLTAIFIVARGLEFAFPSPASPLSWSPRCLNLALQDAFNPTQRLEPVYAAGLLALNIVELAALLFLTGGLQNPFAFPVPRPGSDLGDGAADSADGWRSASRGTCARRWCSSICRCRGTQRPAGFAGDLSARRLASIVLAIGVISLYAFQATEEARQLADALCATELVLRASSI